MKRKIAEIHRLFGGLLICTGLLAFVAISPIQASPDKSNYCSNCHDPDSGTSISVEVVNRTDTLISYNVSGSDNYGDDEGWGVYNPGGNNIANGYFEGTFDLPRDGQTYRVFWVDEMSAYMDIVADEYNAADFNDDGVVNSLDYIVLAKAWRTVPTDGNYNEVCDLFDDNFIDRKDLDLFTAEWLWTS
ncbi:MAG: dockerin type I domain-containing protein [Planctomycetota bacterium]